MNYGKLQYEREKKQNSGSNRRLQLKQTRLRTKIGQHDIDFKVRKARDLLGSEHKLKINELFTGHEYAHHDRGRKLLSEVVKSREDIPAVEQCIKMDASRALSVLLTPTRDASN